MSDPKTNLFLSHATEDQKTIAEPLYEILKDLFEVYYFPESIIRGRSQFESISERLNACDYGVVILSPNYLRKYWTRAELYALWARRMTEGRDIIIPVWWNVTAHDVKNLSPLLVDPNAITAEEPAQIAEEIKVAVGTARQERRKWDRRLQLAESILSKKAAKAAHSKLVHTIKGSQLVMGEWKFLQERCRNLVNECGVESSAQIHSNYSAIMRFISIAHGGVWQSNCNTLVLRFDLLDLADNSISSARMRSYTMLQHQDGYSQRYPSYIVRGTELEVIPKFDERESPIWETKNKELKLTVMLTDYCFEKFLETVNSALSGHELTVYSLNFTNR